jgi:ribosomal protein L21E
MGDIALRGQGRALMKRGGKAMDESKAHEGMESMKMESKETKMERQGFRENKKGTMVKEKMAKGGQTKVSKVMREFGKGKLHSGKKGPVVKSRKQAVAIALSEAGMSKKPKEMKKGGLMNIAKDLKKSSVRHLKQSKILDKILKKEKNNG